MPLLLDAGPQNKLFVERVNPRMSCLNSHLATKSGFSVLRNFFRHVVRNDIRSGTQYGGLRQNATAWLANLCFFVDKIEYVVRLGFGRNDRQNPVQGGLRQFSQACCYGLKIIYTPAGDTFAAGNVFLSEE